VAVGIDRNLVMYVIRVFDRGWFTILVLCWIFSTVQQNNVIITMNRYFPLLKRTSLCESGRLH
jgi:hypothetical protein